MTSKHHARERFVYIGGQAHDRGPAEATQLCAGIDTPRKYPKRHAEGCDGYATDQMGVLEPRSEPCRRAMAAELRNRK